MCKSEVKKKVQAGEKNLWRLGRRYSGCQESACRTKSVATAFSGREEVWGAVASLTKSSNTQLAHYLAWRRAISSPGLEYSFRGGVSFSNARLIFITSSRKKKKKPLGKFCSVCWH